MSSLALGKKFIIDFQWKKEILLRPSHWRDSCLSYFCFYVGHRGQWLQCCSLFVQFCHSFPPHSPHSFLLRLQTRVLQILLCSCYPGAQGWSVKCGFQDCPQQHLDIQLGCVSQFPRDPWSVPQLSQSGSELKQWPLMAEARETFSNQ